MNDPVFGLGNGGGSQRRLYWDAGRATFDGYTAADGRNDVVQDLAGSRWVNVGDRFGLIFETSGDAVYRNPHHWPVFHAVKDELVLGWGNTSVSHEPGDTVASMALLWVPEQKHGQTAGERFVVLRTGANGFAADIEGRLCACNFSSEPMAPPS